MSITFPFSIDTNLKIGTTIDINTSSETPVRLRDLTNMSSYNIDYRFNIKKEHDSITHIGASIHDVVITSDGQWQELANTIASSEIQTMMLSFFEEKIWPQFESNNINLEKWKAFGYFTTDFINKYISTWNRNNLIYWSSVAKKFGDSGRL